MDKDLARLAVPFVVDQNVFLCRPNRTSRAIDSPTSFRRSGSRAKTPLVPSIVARTLVRIPGTGIARTVIDLIELWVVRNEAPNTAAALLPGIRRSRGDTEIGSLCRMGNVV